MAEVEKIPYEIAMQKVSKQVKSIKSFLVEGETLHFDAIGDLVLNTEGKIVFEPSYHVNYLTDAFGLSQFVSNNVTREVYKETIETLEKVIPTITVTPEKRKTRPYLRYAAIAFIALTLGGFAASTYYVNLIEVHNKVAQEAANEQLDAKIQEATFVIDNPLPVATLTVDKQQGNYHIIAGAFRIKENADKKVKQLKALGYKARNIGANKYQLHEVVYSSHQTSAEAMLTLRDIRKADNPQAWLLVREVE
jgi:cell division protein FtsN